MNGVWAHSFGLIFCIIKAIAWCHVLAARSKQVGAIVGAAGQGAPAANPAADMPPSVGASSSGHDAAPPVPAAVAARPPRIARRIEWGGFQLAPIVTDEVTVGYGATCGRHLDPEDSLKCKIQLSLGKDGRFSEDEARVRVKFWCIRGMDAAVDDHATPRSHHVSIKPRQLEVTMSEAEMDLFVGMV